MEPNTEVDFHFIWGVLLRRYSLILGVSCMSAVITAGINLSKRPSYEARALVLIEREGQNALTPELVGVDSRNDDYLMTQYEILRSRSLAERVVQDLGLERHPDFSASPVGALQRSIRVAPVRKSRLAHIVAEAHDSQIVARIANAVSERFIQQNLESKTYLSRDLLRVLADDAKGQAASIESLPAVVNNTLVQHLKMQMSELQKQWAEASKTYQPRHPAMMQLEAQLRETRSQIDREVRHIADSVKIQLSGQLQGNNIRVIDPALTPALPSKPRTLYNTVIALCLGLACGIILAFIVDQIDLTVRSPEDLENLIKIPCLGMVHWLAGFNQTYPRMFEQLWSDSRSQAAEGFRNLRTAISFRLSKTRGPTVFLVTSSVMGEGKSLISGNLARAFAQNGERVLLIDGDMRRPSLHKSFDHSNESGLSTYLTAADGQGPEALVRDSGIKNLKLLVCGPLPDNPAELLTEHKLKPLINWAMAEFDRVIIDSPPLFPVTDALLWGRQVHGIVFIVRSGKVRAAIVSRAVKVLRESFIEVIGGIVNQTTSTPTDSYYHYYRYYRYYRSSEKTKDQKNPETTRAA